MRALMHRDLKFAQSHTADSGGDKKGNCVAYMPSIEGKKS